MRFCAILLRMSDLTPKQLHLLREIALLGGESIIRHHRCHLAYEALEAAGLIRAFDISKNETRYKMTSVGRTVLDERSPIGQ